jgi:hypothetical protein
MGGVSDEDVVVAKDTIDEMVWRWLPMQTEGSGADRGSREVLGLAIRSCTIISL